MIVHTQRTKQAKTLHVSLILDSLIIRGKCSAVGRHGPSSVSASVWRPEEGQGHGGSESLCWTAQGTWAETVSKEENGQRLPTRRGPRIRPLPASPVWGTDLGVWGRTHMKGLKILV